MACSSSRISASCSIAWRFLSLRSSCSIFSLRWRRKHSSSATSLCPGPSLHSRVAVSSWTKGVEGRDGETLLSCSERNSSSAQMELRQQRLRKHRYSHVLKAANFQSTKNHLAAGSQEALALDRSLRTNWLNAWESKWRPYLHFLVSVMQASLQLLDDPLLLLLPAARFGLDLLFEPAEIFTGCWHLL